MGFLVQLIGVGLGALGANPLTILIGGLLGATVGGIGGKAAVQTIYDQFDKLKKPLMGLLKGIVDVGKTVWDMFKEIGKGVVYIFNQFMKGLGGKNFKAVKDMGDMFSFITDKVIDGLVKYAIPAIQVGLKVVCFYIKSLKPAITVISGVVGF